jgi:hypothetical protein
LEKQFFVFMYPDGIVAQLYPPAQASFFDAFYDTHGYGEYIPTSLHTDR